MLHPKPPTPGHFATRRAPLSVPILLAVLACQAQAQSASEGQSSDDAPQLEAVTVSARRSIEQRFNAAGSLVVVDRKDIEALGAFSVADVLRQLPSVQVTPSADGGVEIRMRGMEASATQLLIDGQRVSSGKSQLPLDQLPSELIERIEVVRAPSAEFSGATGGTLNIVLRSATVKRETNIRLTDNTVWGKHAGQVFFSRSGPIGGGTAPAQPPVGKPAKNAGSAADHDNAAATAEADDRPTSPQAVPDAAAQGKPDLPALPKMVALADRPWSYFVAASSTGQMLGSDVRRQTVDAGQTTLDTNTLGRYRRTEAMLLPKVSGHLGVHDQLTLRGTLSHTNYAGSTNALGSVQPLGQGSPYPLQSQEAVGYKRRYLQAAADWSHGFADSKLESTLNASQARYALNRVGSIVETAGATAVADNYSFTDDQRDSLVSLKSKLTGTTNPLLWSMGFELDARRLSAGTTSADTLNGGSQLSLGSSVQRQVLWGQNEWELPANTTLTAGLRGETIQARSTGSQVLADQRWSFLQPSLHTRTPINDDLQWRVNLARVTRLPNVWELVNRTTPSSGLNSLTNPDYSGNPGLKPEVALSLDTGFEQRLGSQGQAGLNLFVRSLSNTLASIVTPVNGRWVQQRSNVGDATVWGLEADVKTGLTWLGLGRDWTLGSNASLLQSRLENGPNAGNRIPGQARYTASVNIAKPIRRTGGLFGGATVQVTGPAQLNTSPGITGQERAHASLDLYLGGVLPQAGYWRIGVFNIGNARYNRDRYYADSGGQPVHDASSMTLTPRVYLTIGTQFCDNFKPC